MSTGSAPGRSTHWGAPSPLKQTQHAKSGVDVLPSAKARGFFLALASYANAPVGMPPHARGGRHRPNYGAEAPILAHHGVTRGLTGVLLVISDAHQGLQHTIQTVFPGVVCERCRVHCLRNLLSTVPRSAQAMVPALVRTIFARATQADARQPRQAVSEQLHSRFPAAATLLDDAAEDILAYMAFPTEHWRQLHSTNPLERLNRELARRCDVVVIFPNAAVVLRLAGAVLLEHQDEWATAPRRDLQPDVDGETPSPLPDGLDSRSRGSLR